MIWLRFVGASVAALFIGATVSFTQVDTGAILGTTKDSSGGLIPGAQVTLTNTDTGLVLTTTTASSGEYTFSPVKIGHYSVQAAYRRANTVRINSGLALADRSGETRHSSSLITRELESARHSHRSILFLPSF